MGVIGVAAVGDSKKVSEFNSLSSVIYSLQ